MRIGLLTSGGDAPGMNAAIRAVVRRAQAAGHTVFGIRHGYRGLFSESLVRLYSRSVGNILQTGGSVLNAGRSEHFRTAEGRRDAAKVLERTGIEALIVIGGDGSYKGLAALIEQTGIRGVGVPGTIDNDVGGTELSIGFDTALNTALEAIDRIRDTAFSDDRLFYVEVMGRHAGHIAVGVGLSGGAEAVLVPEQKFDLKQLAARLDASIAQGKKASIIVVAEGAYSGGANAVASEVCAQMKQQDVPYRVVVLGHIQRGGQPTAVDRILATQLGAAAVDALAQRLDPCVVGIRHQQICITPLQEALEQRPLLATQQLELVSRLAGIKHGS